MVPIMEGIGILLMHAAMLKMFLSKNVPPMTITLFVLVLAEYVFIRYCATRRWYKNAPRYSGIELQFKKSMVPTSYIMPALWITFIPTLSPVPLAAAVLVLAFIAHVNIILLHLHSRDKDPMPVNYLSSGHL